VKKIKVTLASPPMDIFERRPDGGTMQKSNNSGVLLPFEAKLRMGHILKEIENTNCVFISYIEDLIKLLVKKGIIKREELPSEVVEKAIIRQQLKKELMELQKIAKD
jgi:hypothetical protein